MNAAKAVGYCLATIVSLVFTIYVAVDMSEGEGFSAATALWLAWGLSWTLEWAFSAVKATALWEEERV